jgi:hypothetical protein
MSRIYDFYGEGILVPNTITIDDGRKCLKRYAYACKFCSKVITCSETTNLVRHLRIEGHEEVFARYQKPLIELQMNTPTSARKKLKMDTPLTPKMDGLMCESN